MSRKRTKQVISPRVPAPVDVPATDRDALIAAYKAGVITAWKRDAERGYRVTIGDRQDEYVEAAKLVKYLANLGGAA
jgi:hypothetical protein